IYLNRHLRLEVIYRTSQRIARDVNLLVARRVHEMVGVALVVEILHFALFEDRSLDEVFRAKLLIVERPVPDVPGLHTNEAAQVSRRDGLNLEPWIELLFKLEEHAVLETSRLYGRHMRSIRSR